MYTISNVVDIWGAKVHKLGTYYRASSMAGGKPKLINGNGFVLKHTTIHNVHEGLIPPQVFSNF